MPKKLGTFLLVTGSVVAFSAILAVGYKKLSDYMEIFDFEEEDNKKEDVVLDGKYITLNNVFKKKSS